MASSSRSHPPANEDQGHIPLHGLEAERQRRNARQRDRRRSLNSSQRAESSAQRHVSYQMRRNMESANNVENQLVARRGNLLIGFLDLCKISYCTKIINKY